MNIILTKDVTIYICKMLDAKSCAIFGMTSKWIYKFSSNDSIWQPMIKNEFGDVLKSDFELISTCFNNINEKDGTKEGEPTIRWRDCYMSLARAYNKIKNSYDNYALFDKWRFENKNQWHEGGYDSFLYRRSSKSMMIPLQSVYGDQSDTICKIKPRRGYFC